jgi:predicted neuraminidase
MPGEVVYEISDHAGLCHCSSIAQTAGGELLCVWYEGAYEGAPDTAIRGSFRERGSAVWGAPCDLFRYPGSPLGNPVLFSLRRGGGRDALYLLFSILLGESWSESVLYVSRSDDHGRSWSNPGVLFPRKGLMAKTRPLELESGRILVPLYDEAGFFPVVLVVEEPDRWAAGRYTAETMARGIAIQPALAALPDGSVLMLCRSSRGTLWKSLSYNEGLSWSICAPTRLPNPNSAVDLLRLEEKTLLLAFNDSATDRHALSVALSRDAGATWNCLAEVDGGDGEYSYPSLLVDAQGLVHLSYTENRFRIKHFQFDLGWLAEHRLPQPLSTE